MKAKSYCDNCDKECNTEEKKFSQTLTKNKKEVTTELTALICSDCKEEIPDERYMTEQLKAIQEEYDKLTSHY